MVPRLLAPQAVAVQHEERASAQQRQGVLHAAAGFQQSLLVHDLGAVPYSIGDLLAEMMDVHDDIADAMGDQSIQRALEQGAAGHGNQRLGHGVGQRPHALAAAGRQDHGGIDHAAPIRRRAGGSRRSTQARKRRQRFVLQRALEHPPDARQMRQVVGLAVALQQRMNRPMMRA